MAKYRSKEVVDAIQYTGENAAEIAAWAAPITSPTWTTATFEGMTGARVGDFVVRESGRTSIHVYEPAVFAVKYEKVD